MRKLIVAAALVGALALSACGKKEEQHEVETTNTVVAPPDDTVIDANRAEPEPVEETNTAKPAAAPKISENEQMLDDAAASGMTARLPRQGSSEPVVQQADASQGDNAGTPD